MKICRDFHTYLEICGDLDTNVTTSLVKNLQGIPQEAGIKTQAEQRSKIFEKFTRACTNSQKFSKWFCKSENSNSMITRRKKVQFKPVLTRTNQYANSPIPQMVALANELGMTQAKSLRLKSGSIIML